MRVLVTGGAGFIGRYVVQELIAAAHDVTSFDLQPSSVPGARHVGGDLTVLDQVLGALEGIDVACHVGAIGDVYAAFEDPSKAAAVNVLGTANVLEAARRQGVDKLVYASTWEVYGKPEYEPIDEAHPCMPDHPYNITKWAGDLLVQSYRELKGLDTIVLRLGTTYGPGMRVTAVLPAFIRNAVRGEPITIHGTGEQFRQFTHVRDIARGFRMAVEGQPAGRIFNLVAPEKTTITQIAELVASKIPTKIVHLEARVGDVSPAAISSTVAETVLGWRPEVPFAVGAAELIEWYQSDGGGASFR